MKRLADIAFLVRPPLLAASATFFFAGAVSAERVARGTYSIRLMVRALPDLGLYLLVVASAFVVNQIFDVESDALNRKNLILPSGAVTRRESLMLACLLGAAAAVLGVWRGGLVSVLVLVGLALGAAYSVPPVRLKARAGADFLANTVGFGWIGFLMGWLAVGDFGREAVMRSLPYASAMGAVFLNTCIPDEAGDRAVGDATTCVVFGKRAVGIAALALMTAAFVAGVYLDETICSLAALAVMPAFAAVAAEPTAANSVLASQLAGRVLFLLIAIMAPLLGAFGAVAYILSRIYYARRFGAEYPRLTGARFESGASR